MFGQHMEDIMSYNRKLSLYMFDRSTVFQEHQLKSSSEIILVHVSRRAFQSRLLRLPSRQLLHQLERK